MDLTILPVSLLEILILFVYLLFLMNRYASKTVPLYVKLICVFSWMLSFSLIIVLPLEIYLTLYIKTLSDKEQKQNLKQRMIDIWVSFYWINFFLTWFFLPISKEYEEAGDFTRRERLIRSIKINLIIYAVGLVLGLVVCIFLMVRNSLNFQTILATVVCLSNGFGLVLIVVLLGHSLVAIPRNLLRSQNFNILLKKEYSSYHKNNYQLTSTEFDLEEHIVSILKLQNKYQNNVEFTPYFNIIFLQISDEYIEQAKKTNYNEVPDLDEKNNLDRNTLAVINKKTKDLMNKLNRLKDQNEKKSEQILFLEDAEASLNSSKHRITSPIREGRKGCFAGCIMWFEWIWFCRIRKYIIFIFSIIFGLLSCLIILAELTITLPWNFTNVFYYMFTKSEPFLIVQILSLIPLAYILYGIQFGLLSIEVSGFCGFYLHHTDASSLLFAATFISRISFPLSFNFLEMVNIAYAPLTQVVGNFNVDSKFKSFQYVLPILLILVTLFNLLNIYDRLMKAIGMTRFQFDDDYQDENIFEGQQLIENSRILLKIYLQKVRKQKEVQIINPVSTINRESTNSQPFWPNQQFK